MVATVVSGDGHEGGVLLYTVRARYPGRQFVPHTHPDGVSSPSSPARASRFRPVFDEKNGRYEAGYVAIIPANNAALHLSKEGEAGHPETGHLDLTGPESRPRRRSSAR